jgi:multidrug efflux pump subunit AcrB
MGVTAQAIDDTLYDAFGQRQASLIFTQLNQYRVILELRPEDRRDAARAGASLRARAGRRAGAAVGLLPLRAPTVAARGDRTRGSSRW